MELKQLQYFVMSVDMGSLSRAAEALYTTQPHISKTIKALEKELNMPLLERTSTGVVITDYGKYVYDYARKILETEQKIAGLKQNTDEKQLRFSAMPSYALSQIFANYMTDKPMLNVRFQQGCLEQVLHQVSHHHVGVGFIFVSPYHKQALKNMLRHKRLEFFELKKINLKLYVGTQSPYYNYKSIGWNELKKINYVQYQEQGLSLLTHLGYLKDALTNREPLKVTSEVFSDFALFELLKNTKMGHIGCHLFYDLTIPDDIHGVELEESGLISFGYTKRINYNLNDFECDFIQKLSEQIVK